MSSWGILGILYIMKSYKYITDIYRLMWTLGHYWFWCTANIFLLTEIDLKRMEGHGREPLPCWGLINLPSVPCSKKIDQDLLELTLSRNHQNHVSIWETLYTCRLLFWWLKWSCRWTFPSTGLIQWYGLIKSCGASAGMIFHYRTPWKNMRRLVPWRILWFFLGSQRISASSVP